MNEFDLANLTLRIGGPRLLFVFNKLNMLPSSSYMYKKLKKTNKIINFLLLIKMNIISILVNIGGILLFCFKKISDMVVEAS